MKLALYRNVLTMKIWWIALCLLVFVLVQPGSLLGPTDLGTAQEPHKPQDTGNESEAGHITLYDLQFGPAVVEDEKWKFLGNMRSFNTGLFGGRLTLMVKFSYRSSRPDIPLRFVIKLPEARQYEQTVKLSKIQGRFSYKFTVHEPAKFLGAGSLYIYYGLSIVDVLDFNILPGV